MIVTSWPLTTRACLSLFLVKITLMLRKGKMGSHSATEAHGISDNGRWDEKRLKITMLLIPGHCHHSGIRMGIEGAPKLVVAEWSWRTEYDAFLHAVHLLLCRLSEPDEVEEDGVLLICNAELLVQRMIDGVD